MQRYIVTGGSGFIGYHLATFLASSGDAEITVIDNHTRGVPDAMFLELLARDNVVFLNEDMTSKDFYKKLHGRYDGIYHLAALNGTRNFYERPYTVLRVNLLTLMNMLEWCTEDNCGTFLFSSSSEAYAGTLNCFLSGHSEFLPTKEDVPLMVDDVLNPRWSYGGSKLVGELLTANYCRTHAIPFRIIRYHNVYGIRMGFEHVLPEFFRRVHERKNPFPIYGGEETRAFCAVRDAVEATQAVLITEKCDGEIIHIGNSTQETKICDLLQMVFDVSDFHPKVESHPAPKGCVMRRCPDTEKLFRLTGFTAKVTLEEAIPEMYRWYEETYTKMDDRTGKAL